MQFLTIERIDQIGILRINRPQVLNALNHKLLEELNEFLEITVRQQHLKAVILTGSGDKAFIAGADIKEMHAMTSMQVKEFSELGQRVANLLETAPFVTMSAVNGYALGAGLEMALACDFIYASDSAKLGFPEVTLGLIPGFGGTQRLLHAVGMRQAKEMIMSGKSISAQVAFEVGIVNKVCAHVELLSECLAMSKKILSNSFNAVVQAKNAINCGAQLSFGAALELEKNIFVGCFDTLERKAATTSFLEKHN